MSMMGCMGIEGANSAKKFWEDHPDMHKAYHFGGWSCQIGDRKAPDRGHAWGWPWSPLTSTAETQHTTASTSKPVRLIQAPPKWREWRNGFCDESIMSSPGLRWSVLSVTEVSQLFDDIRKAASKKAEPIICNVVLINAGRQTEVSMAIALALQYQLKGVLA
jgi:hypothetical protein